jgi:hypothetical protein
MRHRVIGRTKALGMAGYEAAAGLLTEVNPSDKRWTWRGGP